MFPLDRFVEFAHAASVNFRLILKRRRVSEFDYMKEGQVCAERACEICTVTESWKIGFG